MASPNLPNYLRTYRKRLGLSQDEVAFLLGCANGSQLSRYEHFSRVPNLRTALALAVILQVEARALFSRDHREIEAVVCRQARRLAARIGTGAQTPATARKLALLNLLASLDAKPS